MSLSNSKVQPKDPLFEESKIVLKNLLYLDALMCDHRFEFDSCSYGLSYESCGTSLYLDHLASVKPEIFKDKQCFLELIEDVPCGFERNCDTLYSHLDDSLKQDKEIVRILLERYFDEQRKHELNEYRTEVPGICCDLSTDIILDKTILSMLVGNVYPDVLYTELRDEVKLNDDMFISTIYEIVKEYRDGKYVTDLDKSLREIQESWGYAVRDFEDATDIILNFDQLEENIESHLHDGISGFYKTFFGFLATPGFLDEYNGKMANTLKEKCYLYLEYLLDTNKDRIKDSELWRDELFMSLLKKYWYQICVFAAAYVKEFSILDMLYQESQ